LVEVWFFHPVNFDDHEDTFLIMDTTLQRYQMSSEYLRNVDEDWARAIDLIGPCLHDPKAAREPYEALIRAIAYQQLTAKAGDAIIARLKGVCPEARFPTPEDVIAAEFDVLRGCGFSASKIATIERISEGALSGLVPTREIAVTMTDEELIDRLVTIKGVGRWTVEMLLMYSMERMDVLPADDFGVREGYRALKSLAEQPKPKTLREISKTWAPHRTVASWYLWRVPRERGNTLST
jgi:DNA-3-methyladenine glycosylase II